MLVSMVRGISLVNGFWVINTWRAQVRERHKRSTLNFANVRNGSIHAQGVARRLGILCIKNIYSKYVKISRDSQLNDRLSQYTSKRSKTCRCFSIRLLPMQPKFWRSQKTCSCWFPSQKIVVPELTSDILPTF